MIEYKGVVYKTRTMLINSEKTGTITVTIADSKLYEAITKEYNQGFLEESIDNQIYFYVEPEELELSAEEICDSCLDIEFKLVMEIK